MEWRISAEGGDDFGVEHFLESGAMILEWTILEWSISAGGGDDFGVEHFLERGR